MPTDGAIGSLGRLVSCQDPKAAVNRVHETRADFRFCYDDGDE